jgi:hypothetical protein
MHATGSLWMWCSRRRFMMIHAGHGVQQELLVSISQPWWPAAACLSAQPDSCHLPCLHVPTTSPYCTKAKRALSVHLKPGAFTVMEVRLQPHVPACLYSCWQLATAAA